MADKKILVVEDNAIIATETAERCKRLRYSICGVAATGHDAVSLAASTRPDLILMDINLKGEMDGIEAARQIVATDPVPIIYLTAYSDEETLKRAMVSQPVNYLIKPYREWDLYASIEKAMKKKPDTAPSEVSEGMRRFVAHLNASQDGIALVDPSGNVLFLNRQAERMTGWAAGDVLGKPLVDLVKFSHQGVPNKKHGSLSGAAIRPALSCILSSWGGDRIPVSGTWIHPVREETPAGIALAVFWDDTEE